MKKLQFIVAVLTMFVYGCSEQMNPVEPVQASRDEATSTVADVVTPKKMAISLESSDALPTTFISVSKAIVASEGGSVRLQGAYLDKHADTVSYDVSLVIQSGALPYDATISISIDQSSFANDGTITFGPHGLVFNSPLQLSLHATNIDFVKKNKAIVFYYLNNGVMEPMPDSWGSFAKKSGTGTIDAGAQVPHFSRYAFGR